MIVRGQIGPAELAAETLKDPEILRISNATQLIDDPHLTQISEGKRWAQVSLRLRDGRICEAPREAPAAMLICPNRCRDFPEFHLFADPLLGSKMQKFSKPSARISINWMRRVFNHFLNWS